MADRPSFARVAVVGIPGSGKTTLLCALTGMDYARAVAATGKVISAAVRVEEPRLLRLREKEEPKSKLTCPTFELCDTPPIFIEGPDRDRNPGVLHKLRDMTGMVILLKAYEDGPSTEEQLESIRTELLLNDATALEARMKRLKERTKKSPTRDERSLLEEELEINKTEMQIAAIAAKAQPTAQQAKSNGTSNSKGGPASKSINKPAETPGSKSRNVSSVSTTREKTS